MHATCTGISYSTTMYTYICIGDWICEKGFIHECSYVYHTINNMGIFFKNIVQIIHGRT